MNLNGGRSDRTFATTIPSIQQHESATHLMQLARNDSVIASSQHFSAKQPGSAMGGINPESIS